MDYISPSSPVLYSALCVSPLLAYFLYTHVIRGSRLPPSPPSDPIVGHVFRVPQSYAWKTYASWKKTLGDVIYLHFYGSPMIVLNSISVARDLLDKRSLNSAGRPRQVVIGEMLGWSTSLPFLNYGERFKRQRRMIQRYFDPSSVKMFSGFQQQGVHLYLGQLLQDPEEFKEAAQRLVARVVLKATYGYSVQDKDDPLTNLLHRAVTASSAILSIGGGTTVGYKRQDPDYASSSKSTPHCIEMLPILRYVPLWLPTWFPGVTGRHLAIEAGNIIRTAITTPFEECKARKAAGIGEPCFVSKLLEDYEEENRDDPELMEDIKMLGGITYTAGFESTWATLVTFFLMMTLNQDVQKKAQDAIDSIIGSDRLPTIDDRARLPYIDCILKEIFRINPLFAQGLTHTTLEPEQYGEWVIPKGALVSPNVWQMMRDEEYFKDPLLFSPDRYLDKSTGDDPPKIGALDVDPGILVFGFGRRICPGRFFAERTLWLTIASTLAVFDIKPVVDPATGKEIIPVADYVETLTSFPKPFKCSITPRSVKHAQLVRDASNAA